MLKLGEAGIAFAITSGRPPRGMQTLIKDLNISTVVAGFNGGVFATPRLDPIVMRDLPKDAAARSWVHTFQRRGRSPTTRMLPIRLLTKGEWWISSRQSI